MEKVKYINRLKKIERLSDKEKSELSKVTKKFAFRTNNYYMQLINWDDPNDPIRRLVIPHQDELNCRGKLDASNEDAYTKVSGLQHKYEYTALLLVNDVCGAYCRFCFRKRLFMDISDEVVRDVSEGIDYIRKHKEINNVLLTGGDPLIMSTNKLTKIIQQLREIDHVKIIRIGSKMLAFNPYRFLNDPDLLEMFNKYSTNEKRIYLMAHFNHPRELTKTAIEAINLVLKAGVIIVNQTPMLKGVNNDPDVLAELMNKLSYVGVPPYYIFQCRPTLGNKMFSVPVERAYDIFEKARMKSSGLAKRARLVMSHATGKIEVVSRTNEHTYFRYHRAANYVEKARFIVCESNPAAYWFDDYQEIVDDFSLNQPVKSYISDSYHYSNYEKIFNDELAN